MKAYLWVKDHSANFAKSHYPVSENIRGEEFLLWYGFDSIPYTKGSRKFSIFMNTESIVSHSCPHIPNHFLLYYTTSFIDPLKNRNETSYDYTLSEVISCCTNMNDGAHDVNHYYLLPTFHLENNLNGGLTDYLENMNYIFEYGETRHPEYERLYRWGLHEPIKESHIDISSDSTIIDAPTKQSSTKLILTGKKIKKGEIITVSDNDTDSLETDISPEVSILESSTETILPSTNVPDEEVDD